MKLVMIGVGYVGLVSGTCLADIGHEVICVDNIPSKIDKLRLGEIPIFEPGLQSLVNHNASSKRLTFTTDLAGSVIGADVVFIAVGTPQSERAGHADLSYVYAAAREIAAAFTGFTVIVTKSTVPVGTGDEIERIIKDINPNAQFAVVSNPEFLREGAAIEDFNHPSRIVIGVTDERARAVMTEVYKPLGLDPASIIFTSRRTSEIIKYTSNAFLAMKISFINEIADLCEKVGADIQAVAHGIGEDPRIGSAFLQAGAGYGGSCFPKDTLAFVETANAHNSPIRLTETTISINENRKRTMANKIIDALSGSVENKKIAILGLTFKPNTDDMRDSPAITIIQLLKEAGAIISAFDPVGMDNSSKIIKDIQYTKDLYEAAEDADALVILTGWSEFKALDFARLSSLMNNHLLLDLRNIYQKEDVTKHAFKYVSIGRPDFTS